MMTVNENRKQFEQWTLDYQNQKERADRLFSRISTFRILTFLIGAAGLVIGITEKEKSYATLLVIAGVLFLIGFVALVKWHSVVAERQEMLTEKWEVCRRYCNRFTDGWRKFEEKGTVYLREDDCVAADIDLLGENSLYQMISVCHTEKGKQTFADHLTTRYIEEAEREQRHAAIKELSGKPEFAVEFETAGRRMEAEKEKFDAEAFEDFAVMWHRENSPYLHIYYGFCFQSVRS